MNWKERIDLCIALLDDMKNAMTDDSKEEKDDLGVIIDDIGEYVSGDEFTAMDDDVKELESWKVLISALYRCHDDLPLVEDIKIPYNPVKVTRQKAYDMLIEEYAEAMRDNNDEIPSMNINDWMHDRKIVIADDESSSSENDTAVNSRTKF